MKINVTLLVDGKETKTDVLDIPEHKLEALTSDEVEASIEIVVRNWADRMISVVWETDESSDDARKQP